MTNDFNSVFNDDKNSVSLPQVNATKEPQYICNLRKAEWAYHNKLTKQTVKNIQNLKNDAAQNKDDRTVDWYWIDVISKKVGVVVDFFCNKLT